MHCRRRYGLTELAGFLFIHFRSPPKYGCSPSVLRIMGRIAYHWIGIYEANVNMLIPWELVVWWRRNHWITFMYGKSLESSNGWLISWLPLHAWGVLHGFWVKWDGNSVDLKQKELISRICRVWGISFIDGPVSSGFVLVGHVSMSQESRGGVSLSIGQFLVHASLRVLALRGVVSLGYPLSIFHPHSIFHLPIPPQSNIQTWHLLGLGASQCYQDWHLVGLVRVGMGEGYLWGGQVGGR